MLADSVRGELIDTEIEIRSGRSESFAELAESQRDFRRRLFALAHDHGYALGVDRARIPGRATSTRRSSTPTTTTASTRELGYVARRNNTWSLHVHVGVRGADRAIAVCDSLRNRLPTLLALSANSPFLDGRDTGLASVRSQIFTRSFPRCGIHDPFGDWNTYASFVDLLERTGSVVESTQLWWSIRPHHSFGTVEVRICDAQSGGEESLALAGLLVACVVQAAMDYDEGCLAEPMRAREIEENLWRAIRYGLDGRMIDFERGEEIETAQAVERPARLDRAGPRGARRERSARPGPNGAQRMRAELQGGASIADVYRDAVTRTSETFGGADVGKVASER